MEGYVYLRSDWALFINLSLTHSDPSSILRSVLAGWSSWRCILASFSSLSFSISFALFLLFLVPDDEGWSSYFLLEQGFPQWQWLLQLSLLLKQRHLFVEQAVVHLHVFCVNLFPRELAAWQPFSVIGFSPLSNLQYYNLQDYYIFQVQRLGSISLKLHTHTYKHKRYTPWIPPRTSTMMQGRRGKLQLVWSILGIFSDTLSLTKKLCTFFFCYTNWPSSLLLFCTFYLHFVGFIKVGYMQIIQNSHCYYFF